MSRFSMLFNDRHYVPNPLTWPSSILLVPLVSWTWFYFLLA